MRLFYFSLLLVVLYSHHASQNIAADTDSSIYLQQQINKTPLPYDSMKQHIYNYRKKLSASSSTTDYAFLEKCFVSVLVDSILPYWYGTAWDFNGTTQQPGKGSIACGYFVSTVLRDAGIQLNRVKTGQAASQLIIKQFADKKDIKVFSEAPLDSSLAYIRKKGKGIFIVGLDYHVGFLYNDGSKIWFIHSKWVNPKAVVKEDAESSGILYYSKYRMIGKISSNKTLLYGWVHVF
ncbi:MAG TPA: hypothetical protein PL045_06120 [Chitinophagaceae bacterium]|nr:hypothetical protein [Chitinophagaceae bacterium]